jgi:hypothetical protein
VYSVRQHSNLHRVDKLQVFEIATHAHLSQVTLLLLQYLKYVDFLSV